MYFDDMLVGFQFRTESRTLAAEAIKGFAQEWDPQPFYLDGEAAKAPPYGGFDYFGVSHHPHRLQADGRGKRLVGKLNGWPEMKEVRWIKPVFAGDTLRVEAEVLEARASRSKPDRGIVEIRYDVLNQSDEMVAQYQAR